jgi:Cft2 family RNA processing exonuclease
MRIANLNPDSDIGASAWFLELDGHRLLMDTGTHPKIEGRGGLPRYDIIKDEPLDAIAISHCHHDHVGSLPIARRYFPEARMFLTDLSYFLVERVLHNSVNVMTKQRDELGIRDYPLFTHDEVDELAPSLEGCKYRRPFDWTRPSGKRLREKPPTVEFFNAGHALGAAGMLVRGRSQTVFYTGDVCFHDQTILKAADFSGVKADVLIMETTRGNRSAPPGYTRAAEMNRLTFALEEAMQRKACILIPSFALGRTQEILAWLALLTQEGRIKRQPIYIGGLGRVFTEIYDLESNRTHRNHPDLQLHEALDVKVLERGQLGRMKLTGASRIFVLTAGMMSENTGAHDLAIRMAGDKRNAIFFVGYADPDSPAGHLKKAKPDETFVFSPSAGELTLRCDVRDFDLTAHAEREHLLDFVGQVEPKVVVLGHGDAPARAWFAEQIKALHPHVRVHQPGPGEMLKF